jgi:hypothetical protein
MCSPTRLHVTYSGRFTDIARQCRYAQQHAYVLHTTCVPWLYCSTMLFRSSTRFRVIYSMRFIAIAQRCRYVQQHAYALHTACVSWPSPNDAVTFLNTLPSYIQHTFHCHHSTMPLRSSTRFRVNFIQHSFHCHRSTMLLRSSTRFRVSFTQHSFHCHRSTMAVTFIDTLPSCAQGCCDVNYYVYVSLNKQEDVIA